MSNYVPSIHPSDMVPGEQYRYALANFRIAHEQVEKQRTQLQEQERQVALLHARIAALEGGEGERKTSTNGLSKGTVDDYSIKNASSKLERLINRWAADICRSPPAPLHDIRAAALWDIHDGVNPPRPATQATAIHVQSLLRHAMSSAIAEGILNCLIVTDSAETNIQLTRIHEHIFARDPIVAGAWRRQTFSAAIEKPSPEMTQAILTELLPALTKLLSTSVAHSTALSELIGTAYDFSRMLHGAQSSAGDAFYRAYVPELQSVLDPHQIELVKRCARCEVGEMEKVGATVFLGLVKVASAQQVSGGAMNTQTVMRRAMVICECALLGAMPAA